MLLSFIDSFWRYFINCIMNWIKNLWLLWHKGSMDSPSMALLVQYLLFLILLKDVRRTKEDWRWIAAKKRIEDGFVTLVYYNFTRHWARLVKLFIILQSKNGNLVSYSAGGCDLDLSNIVKPFSFGCYLFLCNLHSVCFMSVISYNL